MPCRAGHQSRSHVTMRSRQVSAHVTDERGVSPGRPAEQQAAKSWLSPHSTVLHPAQRGLSSVPNTRIRRVGETANTCRLGEVDQEGIAVLFAVCGSRKPFLTAAVQALPSCVFTFRRDSLSPIMLALWIPRATNMHLHERRS